MVTEGKKYYEQECEKCKIENFYIENLPFCTISSIKNICNNLPKCSCLQDVQNLLTENDTILYLTIYLGMCWALLQPVRHLQQMH